jgi:hypothetical protein
MMEESLHGEFGLASLRHRHYDLLTATCSPGTLRPTSVRTFDPALQHGPSRCASLDVPPMHCGAPRRGIPRH